MGGQQLKLRDIHLPDDIGWWPPAIGWWILAALIPLCCFFIFWLYQRITRKTALKTAKKHLQGIKQDKALDNIDILIALSALLRRVAMSVSPRDQTASLAGKAWLDYLDNTVLGSPFTQSTGTLLATAHYQKTAPSDAEISQLIQLCEDWLKAQKEGKK
ncbi:MAG: DUF4381 domain-containing protein [Methylococcales symbiont of Hymedesmia sp. n. MRB-2018]|nr:MAG: DUF4381 domain-containing protein [Methylococcales symbiont of Hymedesmia sp. n. MRB-2018]